MRADVKYSKQSTLGNSPDRKKEETVKAVAPEIKKQIEITEIAASTREDELTFKISFRLIPSRTSFSRVTSDLYFDEQKIDSLCLRILQGPLASDVLEFSSVLDMTGVGEGRHILKVDMYEFWSSGERLTCATKELTVDYVPVKREDILKKVPIVKSVAGADLKIISDSQKDIYQEMEQNMKKDIISKRDRW